MKTLIVEDDFLSRLVLHELLKEYGPAHIAANGHEAVEAAKMAIAANTPYRLICLDIKMPGMDGLEALKKIRLLEDEGGIQGLDRARVIMTTILDDTDNVMCAFREQCDAYLVKPVSKADLVTQLEKLELI
ncbi:MAG: response regulator [Thermodesulfobacteriota bacterium]|nr:response regulator [Thermodesulfobacteriota bacterium]